MSSAATRPRSVATSTHGTCLGFGFGFGFAFGFGFGFGLGLGRARRLARELEEWPLRRCTLGLDSAGAVCYALVDLRSRWWVVSGQWSWTAVLAGRAACGSPTTRAAASSTWAVLAQRC